MNKRLRPKELLAPARVKKRYATTVVQRIKYDVRINMVKFGKLLSVNNKGDLNTYLFVATMQHDLPDKTI